MFDTLDDFYHVETARTFRIVVASPNDLPLLAFSVLYPEEPLASRILNDLESKGSLNEIDDMKARLSKRMKGYCRDLLDINKDTVHFLHRTVRDVSGDGLHDIFIGRSSRCRLQS